MKKLFLLVTVALVTSFCGAGAYAYDCLSALDSGDAFAYSRCED